MALYNLGIQDVQISQHSFGAHCLWFCSALQGQILILVVLLHCDTMKCFHFSSGPRKGNRASSNPPSGQSDGTSSLDQDVSGSGLNSLSITDVNASSSETSAFPSFPQKASTLRVFTFLELKNATKDFSRSLMIGEGGFGRVYRGTIRSPDHSHARVEVAVKQLSRRGLQGHKEWLTEVNLLGVLDHPNLVKLLGYCAEDDERGIQRLLVYEFMPNRSVEEHLSARSAAPLPWSIRLRVALDAARGLTYLHETMEPPIIFRDFKTSNILLDAHWNAKLSDFGLARHGPTEGLTHVSTAVVGTVGYAAPEYVQTGHLTAKSDIWSYGIVVYELITGRRPLDRNRPKSEQKLLEWIKPYTADIKKFYMIVDPRLDGNYSLRSAQKLAAVANRCLVRRPKSRPNISDVLEMMNRIIECEDIGNPPLPLMSVSQDERARQEGKTQTTASKKMTSDLKKGEERNWQGWWTHKLIRIRAVQA